MINPIQSSKTTSRPAAQESAPSTPQTQATPTTAPPASQPSLGAYRSLSNVCSGALQGSLLQNQLQDAIQEVQDALQNQTGGAFSCDLAG